MSKEHKQLVKRIFDAWQRCNYSADEKDIQQAAKLGFLEEDFEADPAMKEHEDDVFWEWTNKGRELLRRTGRDAGATNDQ